VGGSRDSGDDVGMPQLNRRAVAYDMKGTGVALVFIHQAAMDRRLWHHQRTALASHYRIITVDIMGHGESVGAPEELSIDRAAGCIQQLLKQLDTGAAFLIGVSMGAMVALRFALSKPSLVRGLILVNPWSCVSDYTHRRMERLFRLVEAGEMAAHTDLFLQYMLPASYAERHTAEVRRLRAIALAQNARAVAYTWAACLASDVTNTLGEVRAPSLIIAGLHDVFTPPYLAREVAAGLVDVVMEIWEDTGHFPFLENPSRFNRRLDRFVRHSLARAGGK
jgi:3-oxoadipate enol-lactonase